MLVVVMFVVLFVIFFVIFVSRFVVFELDVIAEGRNMQRVFVRRVGGCFCNSLWSAHDFLNRRFVVFVFFFVHFFCFG